MTSSDFTDTNGTDPTITTGSEGDLVQLDASGKLVPAGATADPVTGEITFDNAIEVPSGSVRVGEVLELSEGVTDLVLADLVNQKFGFAVNAPFDDAIGTSQPFFNKFGPSQTVTPQPIDTEVIITNPLNFSLTGTVVLPDVRLIDKVVIKMNGPVTNFSAKITDNATGLALRYIPSKKAFNSGVGGLNLGAGTNTFFLAAKGTDTANNHFLGIVPALIENGQQLDLTFKADTMDILGNVSGDPFFEAEVHDGPPTELLSEVNDSFDANDAIYPSSNPAVANSRNGHPIIAFDDTVAENVLFNSSMAASYNGKDIIIDIDWVAETATTGGVTWGIEFERNAPGGTDIDSDSFAAQQTSTSTTNGTSGIITRTTITLTQAEADAIEALDPYRMRVQRVVSDVGDDMIGDAEVLRVGVK